MTISPDELKRWQQFLKEMPSPHVENLWNKLIELAPNIPLPVVIPGVNPGEFAICWDDRNINIEVIVDSTGNIEWDRLVRNNENDWLDGTDVNGLAEQLIRFVK